MQRIERSIPVGGGDLGLRSWGGGGFGLRSWGGGGDVSEFE
jgi:hypothetical protein